MAWQFLKFFFKYLGGRILARLAPRLLFFQYYNRVGMQIEEQKKKYRFIYHKSPAQMRFYNHVIKTYKKDRLGMSEVLSQNTDDSVVSIMEVHGQEDYFWDDKTVSTHWEHDDRDDIEIIEIDQINVQQI